MQKINLTNPQGTKYQFEQYRMAAEWLAPKIDMPIRSLMYKFALKFPVIKRWEIEYPGWEE